MAQPNIGDLIDGYRFNGGDPNDEANWSAGPKVGDVVDGYTYRGGDLNAESSWSNEKRGLMDRVADAVGWKKGLAFTRPAGVTENTFTAGAPADAAERLPGSVMQGYAEDDRRGSRAPVRPDVRQRIEAEWNARSPDARQQLTDREDFIGQIAQSHADALAKQTSTPTTDRFDPRVEARRNALIERGADAETAQAMAERAARAGIAPGADLPGQVTPSEFDFETSQAYRDANPAVRGAVKGYENYRQGALGVLQAASDLIGATDASSRFATGGQTSQRMTEAMGTGKGLGRLFEGAVASIAQQLPLLVGGALTGSEALVLGGMAAQSFGQEYGDGRRRGLDYQDAANRASLYAAFEVIGEKFGLSNTLQAMKLATKGVPTDELGAVLAKGLAKEVPGEVLTTTGQFLSDKYPAFGLNKQAGWQEYLDQVADTIGQTVVQSGLMMGGTSGVSAGARFVSGQSNDDRIAAIRAENAKQSALSEWSQAFKPQATPADVLTAPTTDYAIAAANAAIDLPMPEVRPPSVVERIPSLEQSLLTAEAAKIDQTALLANIEATLQPTGSLLVTGPEAAEAVESIIPDAVKLARKDGSVLVAPRFAEPVLQALEAAKPTASPAAQPVIPEMSNVAQPKQMAQEAPAANDAQARIESGATPQSEAIANRLTQSTPGELLLIRNQHANPDVRDMAAKELRRREEDYAYKQREQAKADELTAIKNEAVDQNLAQSEALFNQPVIENSMAAALRKSGIAPELFGKKEAQASAQSLADGKSPAIKFSRVQNPVENDVESITIEAPPPVGDDLENAATVFLSPFYARGDTRIYGEKSAAIRAAKAASDQAADRLAGSATDRLVEDHRLGKFSGYVTDATVGKALDGQDQLRISVYGKEQVEEGLTDNPALSITVNADGEFSIYGPPSDSKTYAEFAKRGWAEPANGEDGGPQQITDNLFWTRLTDSTQADVLKLIGDIHARTLAWQGKDKVGLHWQRTTGATGGMSGRKAAVYFSKQANYETPYSKAEPATARRSFSTTADIKYAIRQKYGKTTLDQLQARNLLSIVQSEDDAIAQVSQLVSEKTGQDRSSISVRLSQGVMDGQDNSLLQVKRSSEGVTQGFYVPELGKSWIIADNVPSNQATAILAHEIGVHANPSMRPLFDRAAEMLRLGKGNAFFDRVQKRMDDAGETSSEEAAAYMVEEYELAGAKAPKSVIRWINDLIAAVRTWLYEHGVLVKSSDLKPADLAAMARAGIRRASEAQQSAVMDDDQEYRNSLTAYFSRDTNDEESLNAKEIVHGKDGFWERLGDGYGFSHSQYAAVLGGDSRVPSGARFISKLRGKGTHLVGWDRPVAGLDAYLTFGHKYDDGTFAMFVVPKTLENKLKTSPINDAHNLSIATYVFTKTGDGKLELSVMDPDVDSDAYLELQKVGSVAKTDQLNIDGHPFMRVDIGHKTSKKLLTESIRRYALEFGDIGDVVFSRMSGANVGKRGIFDQQKIKAKFSKGRYTADGFSLPAWTKLDTAQERLQDRYNRIRDVLKAVKEQGGNVSDLTDFGMGEDRFHGVAGSRIEQVEERVQAIIKDAKESGVTVDEAVLYAYAEHAPERNDAMQDINPNVKTGSGMSDMEASNIIARAKQEGKDQALSRIADSIRAIARDTLKFQLDSGLIDQGEYDAYTNKYQKWVPLRGFETLDEDGNTFRGTGKGFNIRGKENLRALGRDSKAGQILENIVLDAERAIVRGTKNTEVNHRFLQFVMDNPDPDLWEIDAQKTKQTLRNGKVALDSMIDKGSQTIGIKVNGQVVYVKIHDPKLFEQLANSWNDVEFGGIPYVSAFNRYLSKSYTAWAPEFALLTNPVRDILAALVSITGREGVGATGRFVKSYRQALVSAYKAEALGQKDPLYEEYRAMGGKTGFYQLSNLEDKVADINALIKDTQGTNWRNAWRAPIKAAKLLEKLVSGHAGALENATRLASYIALRKAGQSREKSAEFAKNLNVNFNRRGTWTAGLGSIFLFFNPAVQGTHNMYVTLTQGKHKAQAWALLGAASLGMATLAMLNAGAGEDDDGVAWWDKIPAYEKERNIIIVLPAFMKDIGHAIPDSTGRYIKFPLPYGWNAPLFAATLAADVYRHQQNPADGVSPGKAALALAKSVFQSFSPVNGLPPNIDPFYRHFANKNAFGEGQLYPENKFNAHKPDSEKYSAAMKGSAWQEWASFVNGATGGNQFQEGLVSLPPAVWRNYVRSFVGGPASFASGTYDAFAEDDVTKAPFVRKLYNEIGARQDQNKFREVADAATKAKKAFEDAAKVDKPTAEAMLMADRMLIRLGGAADQVEQQLGAISKQDSAIKDSKTLTDAEKRLKLQINEKRRSDAQEKFLKQWRETVGKSG